MWQKNIVNEKIQPVLIAILFLSTQYTLRISNPFSVDNVANINLCTLILVCLAVWCVCYQIIIRQKYRLLSIPATLKALLTMEWHAA